MFKIFWFVRFVILKIFLINALGWRSYIGKPVFFCGLKKIKIGNRFRLYPGWRIETHEGGRIIIHDDVSIGHGFHLVSVKDQVLIGKSCVISSNVMITNADHGYEELNVPIYQQKMVSKDTNIGDYCFIGAGAKILPGTVLGKQCVVGANAVVKGCFPDRCVISGAPAKIIKRYDSSLNAWVRV